MNKEFWIKIENFPNYSISNFGRIRRDARQGKVRYIKEKILSFTINNNKYLSVKLAKNGKSKALSVHALVAYHFIGPRPKSYVINHKDFNRANNHIDNLEYCSQSENNLHSSKAHRAYRGTKNGECKLNEDQVKEIRCLINSMRQCDIAKKFNVHRSTIYLIKEGKNWSWLQ